MEKEYAIKVENLTKKFNHDLTAVDGISFSVEKGEIFGLLGPNGAGKTTTINMLSTMLEKTSGYAELAGYDISKSKDDVRRSIGVVFQDPALDTKLTGRENLEFHSMMYGIPKKERDERIGEVLALVELHRQGRHPGREIFRRDEATIGNRQRTYTPPQGFIP